MSARKNRRDFLMTSAILGGGYFISTRAAAESTSPNERIRLACIGVDGRGGTDAHDASRFGDVVAICDVDDNKLTKAGEKYASAKRFVDFRKMFDEAAGNFDAVTIGIPDHCHAVVASMAMKAGKHCYCEK